MNFGLFIAFLLSLMAGAYFLPSIIGALRGHRRFFSIFSLNFFLGWTLIGWLGALVWACTRNQENLKTHKSKDYTEPASTAPIPTGITVSKTPSPLNPRPSSSDKVQKAPRGKESTVF